MKHNRPNIVWFITDDTNADMLGFRGANVLTPAIDSIASRGVTCTNFHTVAPACCPSRYSYLTGNYPGHCTDPRFAESFPPQEPHAIGFNVFVNKQSPTVASELKKAGYRTGFTGKWHTGSSRQALNGHTYRPDDDPADPEVAKKLREDYRAMQQELYDAGFAYADGIAWDNPDTRPLAQLQYHNLEWHTSHALKFLESVNASDQPFFLNVATTTIHGPHHCTSMNTDGRAVEWGLLDEAPQVQPSRQSVFERLNEAGIEPTHRNAGALWTDDAFKAVMDKIEAMGQTDNTVFVFSTDHGAGVTNGKFTCYQSGVQIPFAIQWNNGLPADTHCDTLLQNIDFLPTMLHIAGCDSIPACDGQSFLDQVQGKQSSRDSLYFEWGHCRGVRTREWKYIAFRPKPKHLDEMKSGTLPSAVNYRGDASADYPMHHYPHYFEPDQLYCLSSDPHEQHNLAADPAHQEQLQRMRTVLQQYLTQFSHPFPLDIDPFLLSDEYAALAARLRDDRSIFEAYYIKEKAY